MDGLQLTDYHDHCKLNVKSSMLEVLFAKTCPPSLIKLQ